MSEHVLDDKTKKALTGLMPCTEGSFINFTPDELFDGVDEKYRPIFTQRAFNREERKAAEALIAESMDEPKDEKPKDRLLRIQAWNTKCHEMTRKTIINWRQFFNPATGEETPFKKADEGGADVDIFDGLYGGIKSALFGNVYKISNLSAQEKEGLKSSPESTKEQ